MSHQATTARTRTPPGYLQRHSPDEDRRRRRRRRGRSRQADRRRRLQANVPRTRIAVERVRVPGPCGALQDTTSTRRTTSSGYVLAGTGSVTVGGVTRPVKNGDVWVIPANTPHGGKFEDAAAGPVHLVTDRRPGRPGPGLALLTVPDGYEPLEAGAVEAYLDGRPDLRARLPAGPLTVREVGDGNLNLVFVVRDHPGRPPGIVLKQSLPDVRVHGESWPLTIERIRHRGRCLSSLRAVRRRCHPAPIYGSDGPVATCSRWRISPTSASGAAR